MKTTVFEAPFQRKYRLNVPAIGVSYGLSHRANHHGHPPASLLCQHCRIRQPRESGGKALRCAAVAEPADCETRRRSWRRVVGSQPSGSQANGRRARALPTRAPCAQANGAVAPGGEGRGGKRVGHGRDRLPDDDDIDPGGTGVRTRASPVSRHSVAIRREHERLHQRIACEWTARPRNPVSGVEHDRNYRHAALRRNAVPAW